MLIWSSVIIFNLYDWSLDHAMLSNVGSYTRNGSNALWGTASIVLWLLRNGWFDDLCLNAQGVRRSTLMKKFGGLFTADGMLDCFQIEICESLDNPLMEKPADLQQFKASMHHRPARQYRLLSPGSKDCTTATGGESQRALLCHRFSTKITLRDVVGFNVEGGKSPLVSYYSCLVYADICFNPFHLVCFSIFSYAMKACVQIHCPGVGPKEKNI